MPTEDANLQIGLEVVKLRITVERLDKRVRLLLRVLSDVGRMCLTEEEKKSIGDL